MPDARFQMLNDHGPVRVGAVSLTRGDSLQTLREKLARIVLDGMYQFVGLLDAEGRTLEINRAALQGAGLRLDDIVGQPFWEARWFQVSQETIETQRDYVRRAQEGEFIRCDMEVYGDAAGDRTIMVDFSLSPIRDDRGRVAFLLAEGRNISEKKKIEAELARRNVELQALLEQVRQLDRLKSDMFANVSHELRTPLAENSRKLNELGVMMIDLTPAAIGPYCVPPVNLREHVGRREMNVNMVTCGGQATIPMVAAVSRVQPVAYGEIMATVSSRSVGPGTRKNIDEFTRTTAGAVEKVGGARKGKAIIVINPAEPPLIMRDTIHCLTLDAPKQDEIRASVDAMIREVQKYVPGYQLVNGPVFDGNRVSMFMEVEGLGDYLPKYAGNLDIMTAAAARTAEMFAEEILAGTLSLEPVTAATA